MTTVKTSEFQTVLDKLFVVFFALFFLALAYNHFQIITHSMPLDAIEAAIPTITHTIASGENPYAVENQPARASVYPVLYNIVVAPFTLALANTLELHRAINGLFIVACCMLVFYATRRAGGTSENSFAGAVLLYAGLLFHSTPIASPNGLGLFLFLASIIIPWRYTFSSGSLFAALLLGLAAFYTKQYFIASIGYVSLYLFLAVSKKKAVTFGLASFFLTLVSLFFVNYTSPYFIDNTIFAQIYAAAAIGSNDTTVNQLLEYFWINSPLLIVLAWIFITSYASTTTIHRINDDERLEIHSIINWNGPLFRRAPSYFWLCFFCSLAIIVLVIGRNPANHMTYLLQLMSPFLIIGIFSRISDSIQSKWLCQLLLIATFCNSYATLTHDFSFDEDKWNRLRGLVLESEKTYAPALLATEILGSDGEIYQNSHTPYFAFAQVKPVIFAKDDPDNTIAAVWEAYVENINGKIERQEFDLIILDQWTHLPVAMANLRNSISNKTFLMSHLKNSSLNDAARLKNHYRKAEVIALPMDKRPGGGQLVFQIWKPIRDSK